MSILSTKMKNKQTYFADILKFIKFSEIFRLIGDESIQHNYIQLELNKLKINGYLNIQKKKQQLPNSIEKCSSSSFFFLTLNSFSYTFIYCQIIFDIILIEAYCWIIFQILMKYLSLELPKKSKLLVLVCIECVFFNCQQF